MNDLTPQVAVQKLLWIIEVQAHINDCCQTMAHDRECIAVVSELQQRVDQEWDCLKPVVGDRPRPYSAMK